MPVFGKEAEYEQCNDEVLYTDVPAEHNNIKYDPDQYINIQNTKRDKGRTIVRQHKNCNKKYHGTLAQDHSANM